MRLNSMNPLNERRSDNTQYYILAVLGGVFVGIMLKFLIKALTSLTLLVIEYWMWVIGIILAILILLRLRRKRG